VGILAVRIVEVEDGAGAARCAVKVWLSAKFGNGVLDRKENCEVEGESRSQKFSAHEKTVLVTQLTTSEIFSFASKAYFL